MRLLVLSFAVAAVAACGSSETPPDADEALACVNSRRGDDYAVGLHRAGTAGLLDFKFVSADPAPPARNLNTWVLQVSSIANGMVGAPATGATMTVYPYMPDHKHGAGAYTVQVQAMPDAGQYKLTQINTWMPGYWEVTIMADVGGMQDTVVFKFCIQA
jgi:hypothetical protein